MIKRWRFAWAWTIGAVLTLGLVACHPNPPPVDCRTTGCPEGTVCKLNGSTYACVPDPDAVPAIDVGASPELLMRTEGTQVVGTPVFVTYQCCLPLKVGAGKMPPLRRPMKLKVDGTEINTLWPLASVKWQDFAHPYGANMYGWRINAWKGDADHESDWVGIGGPFNPDMTPNSLFWTEARSQADHARRNKDRIEISFDTWYCKWAQQGADYLYLSPEDVAACGIRPSPGIEKVIRTMVKQTTCMGNVVYNSDVEGSQIPGTKREWYDWVYYVIRDEEKLNPCLMPDGTRVVFVHDIGTNSDLAYGGPFEFHTTHSRAPLTGPLGGTFTMTTEYNPAFTPEEAAGYFKLARDCGQAFALWRAELSDADFVKTFQLFKAVVDGGSAGCVAPPADDPRWQGLVDDTRVPLTLGWLNAAKAIVGDPTKLPGETVWDRGLLALRLVAEELRKAAHCAGGPWADSNVIQAPDDGRWEEMHTYAFTNEGGWTGDPFRNKNQWTYPNYAVPVSCPSDPPATVFIWCKPFGTWEDGIRYDCTPQQKRQQGGAPVWPEGPERAACELRSMQGPPTMSIDNPVGSISFKQRQANRLQFVLTGDVGASATLHCYVPATPGVDLCNYTVTR